VPAAPAPPGALRAWDTEDLPGLPSDWDRWLADDALNDDLPGDPDASGDAWPAFDPLADDLPGGDGLPAGWPDVAGGPDWAEEPDWAHGPGPVVREVLKAGFWDRSAGDGAGFAAGGVADTLPPGPVLAGWAGDAWADGLGRLTDDELVGVLRAARRLASWAAALELAAVADLWARRTAEEDAGEAGVACHADDEVAAALTLTSHAAGRVLDLALGLARLPLTGAALAAGAIDLPRAGVVAAEVTGLADGHAAAVDRAVAGAAPGQTTGQLRAATRRAVLAADPSAARRRTEEALAEARVERWDEPAGTAALAGRDLPPAEVLAADQHLTDLARQLKDAGVSGTMDALRARVYLALLSGVPVTSLLPANPDGDTSAGGSPAHAGSPAATAAGLTGRPAASGAPGALTARGNVHLTLPLSTWLGLSETPGQVAGFGPVDAADARGLAASLAAHPGTTWCLTLTGRDGHPVAHGCARAGRPRNPAPRPGPRRAPGGARRQDRRPAATRAARPAHDRDPPRTDNRDTRPARSWATRRPRGYCRRPDLDLHHDRARRARLRPHLGNHRLRAHRCPAAPGADPARHLHLPRLPPPRRPVRPGPHPALRRRRPDVPVQPGRPVPAPPPGQANPRLGPRTIHPRRPDLDHPRRAALHHHPHRVPELKRADAAYHLLFTGLTYSRRRA
jgi:hypothetical protein